MTDVDQVALKRVLEECHEVCLEKLTNLIFKINKAYAAAKSTQVIIDFERIRDEAIERCGLWTLFNYKLYQSAVGKYYGYKRGSIKEDAKEPGTVLEADTQSVLIVATEQVTILFKANVLTGKLRYQEVDTGGERFAPKNFSKQVPEAAYARAKRKALAVMNTHRGFR